MQTILLATDFSERSDRALRRAVLLARESGARIHLTHVVDDDRPRRIVDRDTADARTLLEELAHSLKTVDGVSCNTQILQADPFAGIEEAVSDVNPDLLILGPHRRRILRDEFIGTTAERSIRAVSCPVLMANGPPVGPYKQVLLTTDLSDSARAALQRFEQLNMGMEYGLTALHAFDAPALRLTMTDSLPRENQDAYLHKLRTQARHNLVNHLPTFNGRQATLIARHIEASVAHEILTTANDLNADLIVVSARGKRRVARILTGSVTEQVLQSACVDVLAIPASPEPLKEGENPRKASRNNTDEPA